MHEVEGLLLTFRDSQENLKLSERHHENNSYSTGYSQNTGTKKEVLIRYFSLFAKKEEGIDLVMAITELVGDNEGLFRQTSKGISEIGQSSRRIFFAVDFR